MKKYIKFLGLLSLLIFFATSCEKEWTVGDDEELDYNTITSVAGFNATDVTAAVITDGTAKSYTAKVLVNGPDIENLSGDVALTYSVNEAASSAVEGVNYLLEGNTITLTEENNYLGQIPITILTEGIEAPDSEKLILTIESISTDEETVVLSGNTNQVEITISYSCFSDLEGSYYTTFSDGSTADVNIEQIGLGEYRADNLAPLSHAGYPVAPFIFTVTCGEIIITDFPAFSNELTGGGMVNEDGSITFTNLELSGIGKFGSFTIQPN